jgi:predicted RND superfamily exporter protein
MTCTAEEMRELVRTGPKDNRELKRLADCLQAVKSQDFSVADLRRILDAAKAAGNAGVHGAEKGVKHARNRSKEIQAESESRGLDPQTVAALAAAVVEVEQASNHTEEFLADGSKAVQKTMLNKYPLLVDVVAAIQRMSDSKHGMLLLPSGYAAMLKLCEAVQQVGNVSSMLGPAWLYHQRVDWMIAVSANTNPSGQELLGWYVDGNHALLQVHPTFPSSGAGSAKWIVSMREALAHWEAMHPGYKVELSGGSGGEANILYWLEMKDAMEVYLWEYLSMSTLLIMAVVYISFQSVLVPLRLAIALFFTLAATYGAAAIIYQTPLLHGVFPNLRYYDGIYFEVVPLVTGLMIALGLDYDIFLISRIVEFRTQRYSDRASIFRGVLKTGNVISGAGMIMTFSFSGLLVADKVFFQQFGVLLSFSVLFDTFVVRTVLVPALMLIARDWNWWPREMPPIIHDALEGEVESCGGLSQPMLGGTLLDSVG